MLALHTQGSVIYPGPDETAPPGAHALAQAFSDASGDTVITTGDGKGVMIRYTFTE